MNWRALSILSIFLSSGKILSQTLPAPLVIDGVSCGAGNLVLVAESEIIDLDLIFNWYSSPEDGLQLLGSIEGSQGKAEFITPTLTSSETFFVGISLNGQSSGLVPVVATIENYASIAEATRIELCDEVVLHSNSTFVQEEVSNYQWQRLTAQENGEALFENVADETAEVAIFDEIGFYRVVITRSDGCQAISSEVEVTDNQLLYSLPLGAGEHCFTDNEFTHTVELSSEYGREITEYIWEESSNGTDFTEISTEQTVQITKDPAIVSNTTVFYRLTVIEQNCFEVSEIVSIDWVLGPNGTIIHSDPGIGHNDFFYCGTDDVSLRTLEVESTSPLDVSVLWIRGILLPGVSLDFVKGPLRTLNNLDPQYSSFFEGFELIGTGPMITLEEEHGGLIYAIFVDNVTGCENFSDNAIFADTAFPFSMRNGILANEGDNVVCMGEGTINFDAYDQSADDYSWQKLSSGSFVEIGTNSELLLDASIESVAGIYQLEVTKNGCVGQSDLFSVVESSPPEPMIQASNGTEISFDEFTICPGDELSLASISVSSFYDYRWITNEGTLGTEEVLTVTRGGTYFLEITNGACAELSDPFVVMENPIPSTTLNVSEDPESPTCNPTLVALTEGDESDTYQWFSSDNNLDFVPIANAEDPSYFIYDPGFFYVEVTNSIGCSASSETLSVPAIVIADINLMEAEICGSSDHALLIADSPQESNTYQWHYSSDGVQPYLPASGVSSSPYYEAFDEGYYTLEVAGEDCSAISEPTTVVFENSEGSETFEVGIEGPVSACLGSSITLLSSYDEDQAEYFWLSSADGVDFEPVLGEVSSEFDFSADRFAVQNVDETVVYFRAGVTDAPCSSLSETFALNIVRPPIVEIRNSINNEPSDLFYCTSDELGFALEAFQISTNLKLSYQWSRLDPQSDSFEIIENELQKKYVPTGPGRYRCSVATQGLECQVLSNEIDIITLPREIKGNTTFCLGQEIYMEVDQGLIPTSAMDFFHFRWFHALAGNDTSVLMEDETGLSLSVNPDSPFYGSGSFHFEASIAACSQVSEPLLISESENSFTMNILGNQNQFRGVPFELEAMPTDPDILLFAWEPKDFFVDPNNRRAVLTIPEDYEDDQLIASVSAISRSGCTSSETITVFLSNVPAEVFPKLVTPNGDGLNDFFIITGIDKNVESNLRILNNWGNVVFETKNYNNDPVKSRKLNEEVDAGMNYYIFESGGGVSKGSFYVKK